jgi:hypothetical protein
MSHCAFFEVWNLRISGTAQIFQKSRTHLQIPGARRVTWRQTPYWGPTNIGRHCNKTVATKRPRLLHTLMSIIKNNYVPTSQQTQRVSSTNNDCIMLFREIMAASCVKQNSRNPARNRQDRRRIKEKCRIIRLRPCNDVRSQRHFFFCIDPTLEM